jgi:hypothetical protein
MQRGILQAMDTIALDTAEETVDPAITRAERRLRILEELTEIGMALARALRHRMPVCEMDPALTHDPAESFARISRAIRLTLTLEAKTEQELADLKAGIVRQREEKRVQAVERARVAAEEASEARQSRARELVGAVVESECGDYEEWSVVMTALDERTDEDEVYKNCGEWPLRELVERLCKDLDLHPDWSHWTGDGWDEHYSLVRGKLNPFNNPSRRPLVWAYDEPQCDKRPPVIGDVPRRLE